MDYIVKLISYNRSRARLFPMGAVLHSTDTPGATAEDEYRYFSSGYRGASAHVVIDWNEAVQMIPFDEQSWHAGTTANSRYIGIELCETDKKWQFDLVWKNGVQVFSDLFLQYGWSVNSQTLPSHREISQSFGETDHTDPDGYFAVFGKTVDDFREDVKGYVEGGLTVNRYEELKAEIDELKREINSKMIYNYIDANMPQWAVPTIRKLVDRGHLRGTEEGLGLTDEMLRLLVILDRSGAFDKEGL